MNPKYCVSQPTSKRLKELGFPQDTDFYWTNPYFHKCSDYEYRLICERESQNDIAAPHVGELGEWIRKAKDKDGDKILNWFQPDARYFDLNFNLMKRVGKAGYYEWEYVKPIKAKTEVEARAACLIYLAENGLIDPKALT